MPTGVEPVSTVLQTVTWPFSQDTITYAPVGGFEPPTTTFVAWCTIRRAAQANLLVTVTHDANHFTPPHQPVSTLHLTTNVLRVTTMHRGATPTAALFRHPRHGRPFQQNRHHHHLPPTSRFFWSHLRDSNPQPFAYKANALPVAPRWHEMFWAERERVELSRGTNPQTVFKTVAATNRLAVPDNTECVGDPDGDRTRDLRPDKALRYRCATGPKPCRLTCATQDNPPQWSWRMTVTRCGTPPTETRIMRFAARRRKPWWEWQDSNLHTKKGHWVTAS